MSEFTNSSTDTVDQIRACIDGLLRMLGSRDPLEVLGETPEALQQAVAGLSVEQDGTPEKPGKWSIRQVVQHLADSELVGAFRFRMVLAHDGPELPGYDQDLWAERLGYQERKLEDALNDFIHLRRMNLRILRRAKPEDLARVMHHAERGDEPLSHMLKLYAGHDLVHRRQIARIREAIGAPA